MSIHPCMSRVLAVVMTGCLLFCLGLRPLSARAAEGDEALDFESINQQLEEYKILGRSLDLAALDQQLAAGQIDQDTYDTSKEYIQLAAANTVAADMPELNKIVSVMANMLATSDIEMKDLPVRTLLADASLQDYTFAYGNGKYFSSERAADSLIDMTLEVVSRSAEKGEVVSSCYLSYCTFTKNNEQEMIYMVLYPRG